MASVVLLCKQANSGEHKDVGICVRYRIEDHPIRFSACDEQSFNEFHVMQSLS
eukprot:jgi/Psemu1/304704/fgenesh1_kg.166_\